ncbi:MAG: NAD-dependent epimerase/dehydratase family protein, partial [Dehalococcoidia bacterium]|nr:NAD-dependent epimerase/dehydratase family protein [Dehalococcoidia bacterium]
MKACVTGATGFVGSALVRELLKDGKEVKVLIRKSSDTRSIDGLDVEKAYGDIRDKDSVKAALQGCDTLYQTAALYELWGPSRKDFYDVNVEGTKIALEAALEHGLEKVVYTSSVVTLGGHGKDHPAKENADFNVQKIAPLYYTTKYLGEIEALKMAQKGLPVVIV